MSFRFCHWSGYLVENIGEKYGVFTYAYSYRTPHHKSKYKVELSREEFEEGKKHVFIANATLKRKSIQRYMNLFARCWPQVNNADQIFAVSEILKSSHMKKVKAGTGMTLQMAIDNHKPIFLFDTNMKKWFEWNYEEGHYTELDRIPKITAKHFAEIGSCKINEAGIQAIRDLMANSFEKRTSDQ